MSREKLRILAILVLGTFVEARRRDSSVSRLENGKQSPLPLKGGELMDYTLSFMTRQSWAFIGVVGVVFLLSVAFEACKRSASKALARRGDEDFSRILAKLMDELASLGFLALCVSFLHSSGLMDLLSDRVFKSTKRQQLQQNSGNYLSELFEQAHWLIFSAVVLLIVLVAYALVLSRLIALRWRDAEQYSYDSLKKACLPDAPLLSTTKTLLPRRKAMQWLEYRALRNEFVAPSLRTVTFFPRLRYGSNFPFYLYLRRCMVDLILELLRIPCWMGCVLIVAAIPLRSAALSPMKRLKLLLWTGATIPTVLLLLHCHLRRIRRHLTPSVQRNCEFEQIEKQKQLAARDSTADKSWIVAGRSDCFIAPYHTQDPVRLPGFVKLFLLGTTRPNRHEALFIGGRNGPFLVKTTLQLVLICTSIYLSFMIILFSRGDPLFCIYERELGAGFLTCFISLGYLIPQVVANSTIVCNIELMKNAENISKTAEALSQGGVLRRLRVITQLHKSAALRKFSLLSECSLKLELMSQWQSTPDVEQRIVNSAFIASDLGGKMKLHKGEVRAALRLTGLELSSSECDQWISVFATEALGVLTLQQFRMFVLAIQSTLAPHPLTDAQLIDLFRGATASSCAPEDSTSNQNRRYNSASPVKRRHQKALSILAERKDDKQSALSPAATTIVFSSRGENCANRQFVMRQQQHNLLVGRRSTATGMSLPSEKNYNSNWGRTRKTTTVEDGIATNTKTVRGREEDDTEGTLTEDDIDDEERNNYSAHNDNLTTDMLQRILPPLTTREEASRLIMMMNKGNARTYATLHEFMKWVRKLEMDLVIS